MELTVQYTGQLSGITGCSEETIEMSPGTSVKALVDQLCQRHGAKYSELITSSSGELRPSTLVIIDGEQAVGDPSDRTLDGARTLMLMTPIAGG